MELLHRALLRPASAHADSEGMLQSSASSTLFHMCPPPQRTLHRHTQVRQSRPCCCISACAQRLHASVQCNQLWVGKKKHCVHDCMYSCLSPRCRGSPPLVAARHRALLKPTSICMPPSQRATLHVHVTTACHCQPQLCTAVPCRHRHLARPGQPSEAQPVMLNHTAALHKYALVCVGEHRVHDSWRHMLPGHRVVTGHASSQLSGGMTRCTSFAQACRPQ